jgi:hypothetical protein
VRLAACVTDFPIRQASMLGRRRASSGSGCGQDHGTLPICRPASVRLKGAWGGPAELTPAASKRTLAHVDQCLLQDLMAGRELAGREILGFPKRARASNRPAGPAPRPMALSRDMRGRVHVRACITDCGNAWLNRSGGSICSRMSLARRQIDIKSLRIFVFFDLGIY